MNSYRKKTNHPAATWIRLTIYIVLLLIVGASMRLVVSRDGREFLGNMFGSSEPQVKLDAQKMNWCPLAVNKITVISNKREISNTDELYKVCETESEPYELKDLEKVSFQPFLSAFSGDTEQVTLEKGSTPGFFRIGDLPFRSSSLEKEVSKYR